MKKIGITGIDTNVGKTIVSAILVEALQANYWKLIQAGDLDQLDSDTVKQLVSNPNSNFFDEKYLLSEPMSPHAAAVIDGIEIEVKDFEFPTTTGITIVEGAGGIMVPINLKGDTIGDLFAQLVDEVIIVSKHYLGSINHTLLTVNYLQNKRIPIKGIVFVGSENKTTEKIVESMTGVTILGRIPIAEKLSQEFIKDQAKKLKNNL